MKTFNVYYGTPSPDGGIDTDIETDIMTARGAYDYADAMLIVREESSK